MTDGEGVGMSGDGEKGEELLGSHPANALNRPQEGGAGVPEPVPCPSAGSAPEKEEKKKIERVEVSNEKSENVRMLNEELMLSLIHI